MIIPQFLISLLGFLEFVSICFLRINFYESVGLIYFVNTSTNCAESLTLF